MTVCTRAWECTWQRPAIPIIMIDKWNQDDAAKITMIKPYRATDPSMSMPLGSLSPEDAIRAALHTPPIPIAVTSNPCPVAPTLRRSRAKTGKSVLKGTMNKETNMTVRRPMRTASFPQLNFHPSMIL